MGSELFDVLDISTTPHRPHQLALQLSKTYKRAVLLFCDDEEAAGGHVLFVDGELSSREIIDGRGYTPLRRTLNQEQ